MADLGYDNVSFGRIRRNLRVWGGVFAEGYVERHGYGGIQTALLLHGLDSALNDAVKIVLELVKGIAGKV